MGEAEEVEAKCRLELKDLPTLRRLGRGLSGYLYETTWGGNKCARKEFPLGSAERNCVFEREVKKVCKLDDHPNVVKCFGYTIGRNSCSLVQEYVADNLQNSVQRRRDQEVIRRRGTSTPESSRVLNLDEIRRFLSSRGKGKENGERKVAFEAVPEAADIISQIATGMRHLHEKGVVHGDLKPRNVLVLNSDQSGGWKVKLADYGLTETKKSIRMVSERTRRAEILSWKAPECLGKMNLNRVSLEYESDTDSDEETDSDECSKSKLAMADVYSFGLTCSYILGGKPMSSDMSLTQLRQRRMQGFKPKLPESASLEYLKFVIGACLEPEPLKRPAFFMICMMEVAPSHLRVQMLKDVMEGRWRESVPQIPSEVGLPGSLQDRSVDSPEQINTMSTFSGAPPEMFPGSPEIESSESPKIFQLEDVPTTMLSERGNQGQVLAGLVPKEKTFLRNFAGAKADGEDTQIPVTGRGGATKRSRAAGVHLESERRRRVRINEKMRALQELIPNSNKTDKASMLDEAVEYLKMLQLQLQMMSIRTGMTLPPMVVPPGLQQHIQMPQMAAMPSMGMVDLGVSAPGLPMSFPAGPSLDLTLASPSTVVDMHGDRYQASGGDPTDSMNAYMAREIPSEITLPPTLTARSVDDTWKKVNTMSTFSGAPRGISHSSITSFLISETSSYKSLLEDVPTTMLSERGNQGQVLAGLVPKKITFLHNLAGAKTDGEDTQISVTGRGGATKRSRAAGVHIERERRRRDRINEKMRALQELIPNSNKTDKASILDEAIEYLKMLQLQLQMMSISTGMTLPPMVVPPGLQQHMQMPQMAAIMPSMGMGMGMVDLGVSAPGWAVMPMSFPAGPSLDLTLASPPTVVDMHGDRYQASGGVPTDSINAHMAREIPSEITLPPTLTARSVDDTWKKVNTMSTFSGAPRGISHSSITSFLISETSSYKSLLEDVSTTMLPERGNQGQNSTTHNSSLFDVVGATSMQIPPSTPFKPWREHVQIPEKLQNPVLSSSANSGVTHSTPANFQPRSRIPQAGEWIANEMGTSPRGMHKEPLSVTRKNSLARFLQGRSHAAWPKLSKKPKRWELEMDNPKRAKHSGGDGTGQVSPFDLNHSAPARSPVPAPAAILASISAPWQEQVAIPGFKSVHEELMHLGSLRELFAEGSGIIISGSGLDFSQCVRLRKLDIWGHGSSSLNSMELSTLRSLEMLSFPAFYTLTTLQGLSGLQHSLTKLTLFGCTTLRRVPEIGCLKALTQLDMSWSGVEEVPSVQELHSLTSLDLSGCRSLKTLPLSGHLKALTTLDISQSGVEEIPGVQDLISLEELKCGGSSLKCLPGLHHMSRLRKVWVDDTPLSTTDPSSSYYGKTCLDFNRQRKRKDFDDDIGDISDTETP